jgi:hypothetical protein
MRVEWVTRGNHNEASFVVGSILSVKLVVARDGSWAVIGDEGRKTGAKAMSVGMGKRAALEALKELLQTGILEVDKALRSD